MTMIINGVSDYNVLYI